MFNLPGTLDGNYVIFYGAKNATSATIHTFIKPPGCSFLYFYAIGGGGGGGGGRTNLSSTVSRSGGGGGGSGAIASLFISADNIPDTPISVYVGQGGAGGASNTSGSSGGASMLSLSLSSGEDFFIVANGGGGGGAGATAGIGTAGTGGAAATNDRFKLLGISINFAGVAGTASPTPGSVGLTTPTPVTWGSSLNISGGAGGQSAAATAPGGSITFSNYNSIFPNSFTIAGGTTPSGKGADGFFMTKPLVATGGAGGGGAGTSLVVAGGDGGDGAFGCGGGGGGVGGSAGAGRGGNGGPGLVLIAWM